MKTLRDKQFYKCGRKVCYRCKPYIYSEDIKQAIKDLKELSARKHKYTTTFFLKEIDKIMGVWEEQ